MLWESFEDVVGIVWESCGNVWESCGNVVGIWLAFLLDVRIFLGMFWELL